MCLGGDQTWTAIIYLALLHVAMARVEVQGITVNTTQRRLRALQKHLNTVKLLIVDELGYVPFTAVGSELLFEVFSQRYERGATLVTSNLPFDEWTSVFGSERLTGALLDRLTHHVHILEMNGESYRLATAKKAQRRTDHALKANATNEGDPGQKL